MPTVKNDVKKIYPSTPHNVKTKIIKKVNEKKVNKEKEKKVQNMYNNYLLNFLNVTTIESVRWR